MAKIGKNGVKTASTPKPMPKGMPMKGMPSGMSMKGMPANGAHSLPGTPAAHQPQDMPGC